MKKFKISNASSNIYAKHGIPFAWKVRVIISL